VQGAFEDRFWSRVDKTDGCWLWTGWTSRFGYGRIKRDNRECLTHRVSWELTNGPIPDGMCVLHRCDVPACVRPDHLFLGTKTDNAADRTAKGRTHRHGATHCKRGHLFDETNTVIYPGTGSRTCRTCRDERMRVYPAML
jgi:hypothetical protein